MSANEDCKELLEEIEENIQLDIIDETKLKKVYLISDSNLLQKINLLTNI